MCISTHRSFGDRAPSNFYAEKNASGESASTHPGIARCVTISVFADRPRILAIVECYDALLGIEHDDEFEYVPIAWREDLDDVIGCSMRFANRIPWCSFGKAIERDEGDIGHEIACRVK